MNDNQQSALLDFGWNVGIHFYGAPGFDTITRNLKTHDWSAVPNTLLLYCNPGTNVEEGLRRRRKAEGHMLPGNSQDKHALRFIPIHDRSLLTFSATAA